MKKVTLHVLVVLLLITMTVTCKKDVLVKFVRLNITTLTIPIGQTATLTATILPENATNKAVTWESSNTGIAIVNNGIVTAKAKGTAIITVKTQDGKKTATCSVTVDHYVTGVTLNKNQLILDIGEAELLTAIVLPENATNKEVSWTSSHIYVANVIEGKVIANAAGRATITVITKDGNFKATCMVTVSFDNMVWVEGGTFTMGCCDDDEYLGTGVPRHQVTLSSYYIAKYQVTQKLWTDIMGGNPSYFVGDDLPVENINWNDTQRFIAKLNRIAGTNYRLPTEAEWEYAARGGSQSHGYQYSGSNNLNEVAWWGGNSNNTTHPVGTKQPNELGIYDMSGNVLEWCQDLLGVYPDEPQINPQGPTAGIPRVVRGGHAIGNEPGVFDNPVFFDVCWRRSRHPEYPLHSSIAPFGFRLVHP